jgi:riboflavin transporter FmnP
MPGMSKRLVEMLCALGFVLAYILLKALARFLEVDMGEMGMLLKQAAEIVLPMGAGALLFQRPSDAALLKAGDGSDA